MPTVPQKTGSAHHPAVVHIVLSHIAEAAALVLAQFEGLWLSPQCIRPSALGSSGGPCRLCSLKWSDEWSDS